MSHPTAASPRGPAIGFNLAAIAIVLALGGIALAYALDSAGRHSPVLLASDLETTVTRTVGGVELVIPRVLLRYDEPATEGFADEINLRLNLPLGVEGRHEPIDMTLIPRSRARSSARLLDGVYLHQFLPGELSGPPGLVGKPLRASDGFADETVWYDALSPRPFVAKCAAPVEESLPARCLRTVVFDNVAAVYAFDADVLVNWRQFDTEAEAVLDTLGIHPVR